MKKTKLILLGLSAGAVAFAGTKILGRTAKEVSAASVTVISTQSDFEAMKEALAAGDVSTNYRLETDIYYEPSGSLSGEGVYRGTFDGNGHTVTIDFDDTSVGYIALFYKVGNAGKVKNVNFEGSINAKERSAAAVVTLWGTVEGCTSTVDIHVEDKTVGAFAAMLQTEANYSKTAHIENCLNWGSVSANGSSNSNVGGIAGWSYGNAEIANCTNFGSIEGPAGYGTGGILGASRDLSSSGTVIKNCANIGAVDGNRYVGGILGTIDAKSVGCVTLDQCLSAGSVHGENRLISTLIGNTKGKDYFSLTYNQVTCDFSYEEGATSVGPFVGNATVSDSLEVAHRFVSNTTSNESAFIEAVRCHNCANTADIKTKLNSIFLSSTEEALLGELLCYGRVSSSYNSYLDNAAYILSLDTVSSASILGASASTVVPAFAIFGVGALVTVLLFALKKKRA